MIETNMDGLRIGRGYKIRCMRTLLEQIKRDYEDCRRLREKLKSKAFSVADEEELCRVICWLRNGLNLYRDLNFFFCLEQKFQRFVI